jgi:ABC-type lipoprotein export system ATPase subunit
MWTLPFLAESSPRTGDQPAAAQQPLIHLHQVQKAYRTAVGDYPALKNVDIEITAGEFVSVIGKSGSGKTTLINMITGIDRPTAGEVWVNETRVDRLRENQLARWRGKNLGIVFQFFQLLPIISVVENVMLPMDFCNTYPMRQRAERALHLLDLVGLADHAYKLPTALSGGQQQRVAIARALANDPPIVIADEPTGNLDSKTAESVFALFNQLISQGKTIIIVTHDSGLAKRTNRTAIIADGEIVNEYLARALPTLTPAQLLEATRRIQPQHYEAGSMILTEGRSTDKFYVVARGTVEVVLPRPNQSDVIAVQLGPGKYFGEMEFFHQHRNLASVRASEGGPVEVLALDYASLNELLTQSEPTREALHQGADLHEQENVERRGTPQ